MNKAWDVHPPDFNFEWLCRVTAWALDDLASYGHLHGRNLSIFEKAELRIQAEVYRAALAELSRGEIGESIRHLFPFAEEE